MATTPQQSYYAAAYEVAKGSVERARSGAEFVEKAAAAIATVYTGSLALVFSVADNPLPLRAIIPALFLGAALTCAAFYLAWPVMRTPMVAVPATNAPARAWFNAFGEWVAAVSLLRANFLRTALVALVFSVIFVPAPFVPVKPSVSPTPNPAPSQAAAVVARTIAAFQDLPPWPTPPEETLEFQKIRYAAEVAEAARLREEANPTPVGTTTIGESWIWAAAAFAGVILVLLIIPWESWSKPPRKKGQRPSPPGVIVIPYIAREEESGEGRHSQF